ncbi:MAG: hypothetical protein ABFS34_06485 [Gemmatimonadota bacterium]
MSRDTESGPEQVLPAATPPPELEERVVEALYTEGLLGEVAPGRTGRGAAVAPLEATGWRWRSRGLVPLAAAASIALFVAGFAAGQFTGSRSTADAIIAFREADSEATAELVQRAGSAYVQALAALADRTQTGVGDPVLDQGEAAGLAALTAAAVELTRLAPENERAHQVLSLLTASPVGPSGGGDPATQTVWF